ncbi:MAG: hypothetical protein ACUVRD_04500 [Bacteroidia bacterium]
MLQRREWKLFWIFWVFSACASIKAPDGGPLDTQPPTIKTYTLHGLPAQKIILHFSEYLSLQSEIPTGVWLSPYTPLRVVLRGKKLVLRFDSLRSPCHYGVWVGKGIKDFTEGNPASIQRVFFWNEGIPPKTYQVRAYVKTASNHTLWLWIESLEDGTLRYLSFPDADTALWMGVLPGKYRIWGYEDRDGSQTYSSLQEKVFLPRDKAFLLKADTFLTLEGGYYDTVPPALPKVILSLRDGLLIQFAEEVEAPFPRVDGRRYLIPREYVSADTIYFYVRDTVGNAQKYFLLKPSSQDTLVTFFLPEMGLRDSHLHFWRWDTCFIEHLVVKVGSDSIFLPIRWRSNWGIIPPAPTFDAQMPWGIPFARKRKVYFYDSLPAGVRVVVRGDFSFSVRKGVDSLYLPVGRYTLRAFSDENGDGFHQPYKMEGGKLFPYEARYALSKEVLEVHAQPEPLRVVLR